MLLATFNGEQWIRRQLESVQAQKDVDLEVLISDDGSTDRTVSIVSEMAKADRRIRMMGHDDDRRGGSAAANFLHLISDVPDPAVSHIAFCDQDDVWDDTKLSVACSRLVEAGADLYSAATEAVWEDGARTRQSQAESPTSADFLFEGAGQGCTFVGTAGLFRAVRELLANHPDVATGIHYHDWFVYALVRCWGRKWIFDSVPRMAYMQHASNDTGSRARGAGIRRRLALIRSGWYARQVSCIIGACLVANDQAVEVKRVRTMMDEARHSWLGRAQWSLFLLRNGRRRFVDRLILALSATLGFI